MTHCVFCCSNKYQDSIGLALRVKEQLDTLWELEHDCILQSYHSASYILNEVSNTSIYLLNDDIHQLITDCMEFSSTLTRLKLQQ